MAVVAIDIYLIRDSEPGLLSPSPLVGEGGERGIKRSRSECLNYVTLNKMLTRPD